MHSFLFAKNASENLTRKALLGAILGPSGASGSLWGAKRAPERVLEGLLGGQRGLRDRKKVARGGLKSEKE